MDKNRNRKVLTKIERSVENSKDLIECELDLIECEVFNTVDESEKLRKRLPILKAKIKEILLIIEGYKQTY